MPDWGTVRHIKKLMGGVEVHQRYSHILIHLGGKMKEHLRLDERGGDDHPAPRKIARRCKSRNAALTAERAND